MEADRGGSGLWGGSGLLGLKGILVEVDRGVEVCEWVVGFEENT